MKSVAEPRIASMELRIMTPNDDRLVGGRPIKRTGDPAIVTGNGATKLVVPGAKYARESESRLTEI